MPPNRNNASPATTTVAAGLSTVGGQRLFGVSKGARVLGYRQPVTVQPEPAETEAIKDWLRQYSGTKAKSTKVKVAKVLGEIERGGSLWGIVQGSRPGELERRCEYCRPLDSSSAGVGETSVFPCFVPTYPVEGDPIEFLVRGQCIGCEVRGKSCDLCVNSKTGSLPDQTLRVQFQQKKLKELDDVMTRVAAIKKDLTTHTSKMTIKGIEDFVARTRKELCEAKVVGKRS
ncbi:hypothetical protein P7C73_g617, partial [Tremellales sp. Uapishka_1]